MATTYLENLKSFVGFSDADSVVLNALLPVAESRLKRIAEHFYECIREHPEAYQILAGPEQIKRLKRTLVDWMYTGLSGPHDETFYERRARIGRVHVRIGLPQRFMFTAMNVIRRDFHHLVAAEFGDDVQQRQNMDDALDRLFDIELAIMLQTYHEDSDARLRRHERLATIGQIAASIGHDLRNPLGVMESSLYLLRKRVKDDARSFRHLDKIGTQIGICDDIINNLLELARSTPPRREPMNFDELFQEALAGVGPPENITVHIQIESGLDCRADPILLRQALINLISNSVHAYEGREGNVYLEAHSTDNAVLIEIADDGPGFDVETITRVFEPLVTTRTTGVGLGLALVKGVTERHGGVVEASNRSNGGALVRIRLPRPDKEDQTNEQPA